MKIYLATDHAGLEIKNKVIEYLKELGHHPEDCGAFGYDKDDDYPDLISKAALKVSENPESIGIIFGGSGQGEAIVANKFKNVRCALFYSPTLPVQAIDINGNKSTDEFEMLRLTRAHNDSNMLSLGIRFLTEEQIKTAVKIFLESPFPGEERHKRRVEKIKNLE
ncbi:MAG: RpiB/LacA/LacB family sugar-phosphate isomerase [Candidatus Levybacteria bacterium]|nr:RpiB/LacA/LacB family sugar-phosphate isomerase [Candidatus Levybacteria bacterium]